MTTSAGGATAPHEELAATVRADLIMPGDPGHDDAPPQAEQPESGRRRWAVPAVVSGGVLSLLVSAYTLA